ncbi:MAG: hypothetical protein ACRCX8_06835 [Sarcina sp.]
MKLEFKVNENLSDEMVEINEVTVTLDVSEKSTHTYDRDVIVTRGRKILSDRLDIDMGEITLSKIEE